MPVLSVMLVADHQRREMLLRQLERVPHTRVVGEATEPDMLRLVRFLVPDVVVVDCGAAGVNALIVVPWLAGLAHAPQVVAVGATGSAAERRLLLELGAIAYVAPDAPAGLPDAVALGSRLAQLTHGALGRALHKARAA